MQKLVLKTPFNKSTVDTLPKYGKTIKLKNLKWVKLNDGIYMAEVSSMINVYFPNTDFEHIFKETFFIRKDREKLYYISTHRKSEEVFKDINPIFTLKEAKIICQNLAEDFYNLHYGNQFYIV